MINDNEGKFGQLEKLSDEELCSLLQEQNKMAEEVLAARYHRMVRACARPLFLVGGDSEDLLQEGMFGLIKAMREYDAQKDALFKTFAETCIRNRLYSALRTASSFKHSVLNESIPLDPELFEASNATTGLDPEVLLIGKEQAMNLLEDARKLLSDFETKILGYYLDGLTCKDIAIIVGKPTKSVDNAVQRIRKKIAQHLNQSEVSMG